MTEDQLALAHYRMMFPSLASMGAGDPPATWKAEYDRIVASGFSAALVTATGSEGGTVQAVKNFDQKILIWALLTRRAELDSTFDDTAFAPPATAVRNSLGITIRLGI